jgi:hypothetical protein
MKHKIIGQKLSPVLTEIEDALWDFEYNCSNQQPKYTTEGFRASIKIFMSALLDKMWDYQEEKNVSQKSREKQAKKAGEDIRKFIKQFTGIDSHDLYKHERQKKNTKNS